MLGGPPAGGWGGANAEEGGGSTPNRRPSQASVPCLFPGPKGGFGEGRRLISGLPPLGTPAASGGDADQQVSGVNNVKIMI